MSYENRPQHWQPGAQIWKQRTIHGRGAIFSSPQIMWDAACDYFNWIDQNPWQEEKVVTAGEFAGDKYHVDKCIPYTMNGLCIFLGVSPNYFYRFEREVKDGSQYKEVIETIKSVIYEQKFTGAASGFFNAQFIGKDIGLVDRQLVGNDPENPMPSPVTFYIPDNGRGSSAPALPPAKKDIPFYLD